MAIAGAGHMAVIPGSIWRAGRIDSLPALGLDVGFVHRTLVLRGYAHALALDLACEYAAEPATGIGNEDAEDNKSHFAISRAGISGGRPNDLVVALSILRSAVYRSNAATGAP